MSLAAILNISVYLLGEIVGWLIMLRIILSVFVMMGKGGKFTEFIYQITDPILLPIRNLIGKITRGPVMFDFSPMIAWIMIDYIIVPLLQKLISFIFI